MLDLLLRGGQVVTPQGVGPWDMTTILRGKVIVEEGRLSRDIRRGELVPRKLDAEVLQRPLC